MWVILYGYRLKCECLTFSLPFRPVLNLEKICMLIESVIMSHHVITDYISSRDYISSSNHILSRDHTNTNKFIIQEGAQKAGLMLDSNEELYKWFTQQVMLNLHIVFTMNPSGDGLKDKCSTSPALFNR